MGLLLASLRLKATPALLAMLDASRKNADALRDAGQRAEASKAARNKVSAATAEVKTTQASAPGTAPAVASASGGVIGGGSKAPGIPGLGDADAKKSGAVIAPTTRTDVGKTTVGADGHAQVNNREAGGVG